MKTKEIRKEWIDLANAYKFEKDPEKKHKARLDLEEYNEIDWVKQSGQT